MKTRITLALLSCMTALLLPAAAWEQAQPDYPWQFPQDHWPHDAYRTEWWYFTGQVTDKQTPAHRFGFQFTFFRIGVVEEPLPLDSNWVTTHLIMGHAALTDVTAGKHYFSEMLYRDIPLFVTRGKSPGPLILRSQPPAGTEEDWTLQFDDGQFTFEMADRKQGIAFHLDFQPTKPLVFQGPGGYSVKSETEASASLYYSFTRAKVAGSVRVAGRTHEVTGSAWMDREFASNHLAENQIGWDWFSLQLEDGRDLMIYQLRSAGDRVDYATGTLVAVDGTPRYLKRDAWRLDVTRHWTSPATNGRYPVGWRLALPDQGLDLRIVPLLDAQENVSRLIPGLAYWEGAVELHDADGRVTGQGYVELTGYVPGGRLPLE